MYIRSIVFRDWKAFASAQFDFPKPTKTKNVILIGAKNGYGKTSLLEGIIIGLYGKKGMNALARALSNSVTSYDDFLKRALHAQALDQHRSTININIVLEDEEGNRLRIERKWHFNGKGDHKKNDEQILLYEGLRDNESLIKVPGNNPTDEEVDDFCTSFIASKFIPFNLTEFFLFDGERVQQLAKQEKADTVKMGIEGILGVQTLRTLQNSLANYISFSKSNNENIEDSTLNEYAAKIEKIIEDKNLVVTKKEEAAKSLGLFKLQSEEKSKNLRQMSGTGIKNVSELKEEKFAIGRKREAIAGKLAEIIKSKLCIALTGRSLRCDLEGVLASENKLLAWQQSKDHTKDKLEKLLALFDNNNAIDPPLSASQIAILKKEMSLIWDNLWFPPPKDCAISIRHFYLSEKEKTFVINKLQEIEKVSIKELQGLLYEHQAAGKKIDRIDAQTSGLEGIGDRLKTLISEVEEINTKKSILTNEIGGYDRNLVAYESELVELNKQLNLMQSRQDKSLPKIKRAKLANTINELISEAISDLYPKYVQKLADEMTAIYKKLAHKTLVHKITIDSDCVVKLLGAKGRDIRSGMDSSAGEDQIFALALIGAIANVSEAKIPIVMDTPLARLDTEHRLSVLKYFSTSSSEQIILLSQPDEVNNTYYKAIADRVCKTYHISFEEIEDGVGVAEVHDGYFGVKD